MKFTNRLIAFLLSFMILLSLAPLGAGAEGAVWENSRGTAVSSIPGEYQGIPTLHMLPPMNVEDSGEEAQNLSCVFMTTQGKILVIDGGWYAKDGDYLYAYLQKITGKQKPHVDAWFLTHVHADHVGAFRRIADARSNGITVDAIYHRFPTDAEIDTYFSDCDTASLKTKVEQVYTAAGKLKGASGAATKIVKVASTHTGKANSSFTFDDIEVEVVSCMDDLIWGVNNVTGTYSGTWANNNAVFNNWTIKNMVKGDFNNSSTVFRFHVGGKSVLFLADTVAASGILLERSHDKKTFSLKSDIVQVSHHGLGKFPKSVYAKIDAKVALWPTAPRIYNGAAETKGSAYHTRSWLKNLKNILSYEGDQVLKFGSNSLFFDFNTDAEAVSRYNNSTYGMLNFSNVKYWRKGPDMAKASISSGHLVLTTAEVKTSKPYGYIETTTAITSDFTHPLQYTPKENDVVMIRYKVDSYDSAPNISTFGEGQPPTLNFYAFNNGTETYDKTAQRTVDTSGKYVVEKWTVPQSWTGYNITNLHLKIRYFLNSTISVDYMYVGPDPADHLLFDFENTGESCERYNNVAYGFYNYNHAGSWTSGQNYFKTPEIVDGALKLTPGENYVAYGWVQTGATASAMPLSYVPDAEDVMQIRMKLDHLEASNTDTGKGRFGFFYGDVQEGPHKSFIYYDFPVEELSDCGWVTLTIPVKDMKYSGTAFTQKKEIASLTPFFNFMKPDAQGEAAYWIDYIYFGPRATLPAPNCGSEGHSYIYKVTQDPTTSEEGILTGICSVCSETETVTIPQLNTTDYTVTTTEEPTCTAKGAESYTWKITTYGAFTFTATVDALGHSPVTVQAVAPTCTATGLTEGEHCSVCDVVITPQETVAALGHDYKAVITTAPTLVAKGVMTYTCENDPAHSYTEEMEKRHTSLLFDFDNSLEAQERYHNYTYGFVSYDNAEAKNWTYSSGVVSGITVDNAAGTATIQAKGTLDDMTWPAVYMDVGAGKTPLHYCPAEAEYYQIRFKMKNFRIGDEVVENEDGTLTTEIRNPYIKLSYYGDGATSSTSATSDFKAHGAYIDADTWFVATIPLKAGFTNAGEINRIRIYFGGIESISEAQPGEVVIDYVFVGRLEDLPTPAYTVTFVDGAGKTLATQLVNCGEDAIYTGKTPTKTADEIYHYTFSSWDKDLTNITSDTTVTATFTAVAHSYTYDATDTANHKATCTCGYSKTEGHSYAYEKIDVLTHRVSCSNCDGEEITSHVFVDGSCICGEAEIKDPVLDSSLKLSHSLNLASDISINFVVPAYLLDGYDMSTVYVESVIENYKGETFLGSETVSMEPVEMGYYYYFTLTGITAVQMNDTISTVLYGQKDGQPYCSNVDLYSVAQYAYSQMNKESSSATLKTLCADLLRYGAKAQIYKEYRVSFLADADMTEEHKSYLSDMEAVTFGNNSADLGDLANAPITWVGKTLDLDSKVCLKFVFSMGTYTGELSDLSLRVTYTDSKGEEKNVVLKSAELYHTNLGYYAFTLDTLLAAELRSVVTVQIYHGETPVSCTLLYSADTYGNNKTGDLLTLCKALFAYSDSAKAYFTN